MILLPFKDYQSNIKVSVFIYAKISAVKTGGTDLHPDIYSTLYSTFQSMFEEVSEFDISKITVFDMSISEWYTY